MRNLKRALALVMATAMLLSMMVVGAGASYEDFTDSDEIDNTEAVGTMVTLGVISGRDTGAFDPTGTVTRAEMAKMIAVSLNGGSDPILGSGAATTTFTDTSGHWAEAYIAYCANLGIINGYGDGTFGPDDTVTGTAAAKMMLTALGYDSATEGYTGTGWDLNVDTKANSVGLYEGFESVSVSAGLTRDYAAQLIYNGVCSQEIYYYTDDGTGIIYAQNDGTMLNNRFGVVKVTGVVTANEYAILNTDDKSLAEGRTTISSIEESGDHSFDDDLGTGEGTFYVSTDASLLGCTVNLYVKEDKTTPSSFSKATVVGDPVLADETVVGYTEIFSTSDYSDPDVLSDIADIYDLTLDLSADGETTIYYNYNDNDANTDFAVKLGQMITVVDSDNNGTADYVFVVEYSMGEVSTYNSSDEYIRIAGTEYDFEDVVGLDEIAHEDIVNYAVIGGRVYVELAEIVTGELTQYSTSSGYTASLTVDGTKYSVSEVPFTQGVYLNDLIEMDTDDRGAVADKNVDEEITLYLDVLGNVVAIDASGADASYALVLADGADSWGDRIVKVLLSDGTTAAYDVSSCDAYNDDAGDDNGDIVVGGLYTYDFDGDEIILTEIDTNYATADASSAYTVEITNGKTSVTVGGVTKYADEDTAFFYVEPTSSYSSTAGTSLGTTYNGKLTSDMIDTATAYVGYENVASLDLEAAGNGYNNEVLYVVDATDGYLDAVVVITDATALVSDWLYVYQVTGYNSDGTVVNAFIGDEMVTGITITASVSAGFTAKYYIDDDGDYVCTDLYGSSTVAEGIVTNVASSSFVLDGADGAKEYSFDSDLIIGLSDGDDSLLDWSFVKGDYVVVVYENGDEAIAVFVEEEFDGSNGTIYDYSGMTESSTAGYDFDVTVAGNGAVAAAAKVQNQITLNKYSYGVQSWSVVRTDTTGNGSGTNQSDFAYTLVLVGQDGTKNEYALNVTNTYGAP